MEERFLGSRWAFGTQSGKEKVTVDFTSIQNLNGYIKNLKLQSQWSLKQQTGQYNAKGTTLEEWLGDSQRQTQETVPGDHGDDTLRKIHQKLDVGGKLTQKERDYLQEHDPEAYRELINQEREQKAYEEALRRCKTQEEAQQLQMGRINASLARVQSIEHDPHIPLSKKLEIAMAEKNRVDRVAESTREFVASGEFDELPTRSEELQAKNEDAVDVPAPAPEESDQAEPERGTPETKDTKPDLETSVERKIRKARARAVYAAVQTPDQPIAETMDTWA